MESLAELGDTAVWCVVDLRVTNQSSEEVQFPYTLSIEGNGITTAAVASVSNAINGTPEGEIPMLAAGESKTNVFCYRIANTELITQNSGGDWDAREVEKYSISLQLPPPKKKVSLLLM